MTEEEILAYSEKKLTEYKTMLETTRGSAGQAAFFTARLAWATRHLAAMGLPHHLTETMERDSIALFVIIGGANGLTPEAQSALLAEVVNWFGKYQEEIAGLLAPSTLGALH